MAEVGRIILFKECLRWGNSAVLSLMNAINCFITAGLKEFETAKGYLMDTCYSAQDEYKKLVDYFMEG